MIEPPDRRWSPRICTVSTADSTVASSADAPRRSALGQGVGARVAGVPLRRRHVHDGVDVVRERRAGVLQAGGVGVVEDDRVDVQLLGGNLEIVSAGAGDHHAMPGVTETLCDGATELGIPAGEQHIHHQDLLVFDAEPSESAVMLLDSS